MAHEIINVLVYVHDCNIAHLDIKPVNVFRRVGRGVRWVRNPPPPSPPRSEKVRLERAKDELTKKERQR